MTTNTHQRNELILITDISPDLAGSGSQHLKDIIKCLSAYSRLRIVHIDADSVDYHRSKPPKPDYSALQLKFDEIYVSLQILFENTEMSYADQTAYLHRIRINAYEFFSKFNRELEAVKEHSTVVIFVQWPGMIFLWEAFALSKWRTVPILMDWYEPLFISFSLAQSAQALIRDSFDVALSHSEGLLTGSKKAAQTLSRALQVPCREVMSVFRYMAEPAVVRRNVGLTRVSGLNNPKKRSIKIALAGQIYARDTMELFLDGLTRLNDFSHGDGTNYSLSYYGDYSILGMYDHKCITAHGPLEYRALMNTMAESCAFGIVPYSFDASFTTSAAFSFPSKLVAYIQAGLTPIYVGPRESSVFDLLSEYGLAELCITTEKSDLLAQQIEGIVACDLNAIHAKLLALSDEFKLEYLQSCITDVFDRIL